MATNNEDTIAVGVRVRPLLHGETDEAKVLVKNNTVVLMSMFQQVSYEYDHVFGPDTDNEVIFNTLAKHIVLGAVNGINGTIFAYGQTASGKTHTMMGNENGQSLGIIPLAVLHLFQLISKQTDRQFIIRVSYMELYNETITDLQDTRKTNLQIRGDANDGLFVHGLTETTCTCVEDVLTILIDAKDNRTIRETKMNARSSRSHTIFTIIIESCQLVAEEQDIVKLSYLHLVDLAGSEKTSATLDATIFKEGKFINLSLLTLGTVISKLSTKGETHIPYRDSKLTRILQPSLGGNAKTAIICTVSPLVYEETESTLKFAQRAKNIANKPIVNEVFLSDSAKDKKITSLLKEVSSLKKQLEIYKEPSPTRPSSPINTMEGQEMFKDSPLFNRRKTFVVSKTSLSSSSQCHSFLPPHMHHVTLRRGTTTIKSHDDMTIGSHDMTIGSHDVTIRSHDESFESQCTMTSDFAKLIASTDIGTQTETIDTISRITGCYLSELDRSFLCDHRKLHKNVQAELEDLQFEYDEAVISIRENEQKIAELECEKTLLERKLEEQINNEAVIQAENNTIKHKFEELQKSLADTKIENDTIKHKFEELQKSLADTKIENDKFEELQKSLADTKAENDTINYLKSLADTKIENDTIKHKFEELQKSLADTKTENDTINHLYEELQKSFVDSEDNYKAKVNRSYIEIASLEEQLNQLTLKVDSSAHEADNVIEENTELKKEIERLKAEMIELKSSNVIVSSVEDIVKETNSNDTGTQTEESEPDYKKLYEATQTDLENLLLQYEKVKQEAEEVKSLQKDKLEIQNELMTLIQYRITSQIAETDNAVVKENTELKKEIEQLKTEINDLKSSTVSSFELHSTEKLRHQLVTVLTSTSQLVTELLNKETDENTVKEHEETFSQMEENYKQEIVALKEKNKDLIETIEECLNEHQTKIVEMGTEMEELDAEIENLRYQLEKSEQEKTKICNEKDTQLTAKDSEIEQLNIELQMLNTQVTSKDKKIEQMEPELKSIQSLCSELSETKELLEKTKTDRDNYRKERNIFRVKYDALKKSTGSTGTTQHRPPIPLYPMPPKPDSSHVQHDIHSIEQYRKPPEQIKEHIAQNKKPPVENIHIQQENNISQNKKPPIQNVVQSIAKENIDREEKIQSKKPPIEIIPKENIENETIRFDWDRSMIESRSKSKEQCKQQ